MNRTSLLLLAVVVLGALAWYVSSQGQTPTRLADGAEERQFAYAEIDDVHKIFVADRKGHTVTLTRGGETGWLADGKPANENVMKNLLSTVRLIDIQSLPTRKAIPNMVKNLATQGILVQLFDRNGNKLRGYYIGGSTNDETGTYAIKEDSENPYIVHQPGFTGNIRARFNLWDDEWRSKVYFQVDPDKVERLSIDYPKQQSKSFLLEKDGGSYRLSPLYETGQPVREIPRGVAEGILSRYEKYYVNRYENQDAPSIERARELLPFAVITLQEEGQEAKEMRLFPRYQGRTLTNDVKTGEYIESGGLEAFTAFINNGEDWVLLNVETTQPLLVAYDSF
ncbi:hypothetical protein [Lewinella sp. W8]|uniref:hypothetical protein n=1 Tax=Lewinella sp. W8 TaxID=2528208 RepID=UPI00106781FE|nr:hypothetical protein [Lewinella sp. W8]MTB50497.1 hypothetical protein [Lewinella sp. W8]